MSVLSDEELASLSDADRVLLWVMILGTQVVVFGSIHGTGVISLVWDTAGPHKFKNRSHHQPTGVQADRWLGGMTHAYERKGFEFFLPPEILFMNGPGADRENLAGWVECNVYGYVDHELGGGE